MISLTRAVTCSNESIALHVHYLQHLEKSKGLESQAVTHKMLESYKALKYDPRLVLYVKLLIASLLKDRNFKLMSQIVLETAETQACNLMDLYFT